jgi:hypothetical protein
MNQINLCFWVRCLLTDATLTDRKGWLMAFVGQMSWQLWVKCCREFQLWMSQIVFAVRGPKVTSVCSNLLLGESLVGKISRAFQISIAAVGVEPLALSRTPLLGATCKVASTLATSFASVVHELSFTWSWITIVLDPTVGLNGARPANTCIPPSSPWMATTHCAPRIVPTDQSPFSPQPAFAPGVCCAVHRHHSREGPWDTGVVRSSQTVGSIIRMIHEQAKHSSWMTEAKASPKHLATKLS